MTKTASKIAKRTGETKEGKDRKDQKTKETVMVRIKQLLTEQSQLIANEHAKSKLTKTFSLASLLKSLGGNLELSSLLMLGNVITPSAIWAKRLFKKSIAQQNNKAANNFLSNSKKLVNQTITNINNNNLLSKQNLHNHNNTTKINQQQQQVQIFRTAASSNGSYNNDIGKLKQDNPVAKQSANLPSQGNRI